MNITRTIFAVSILALGVHAEAQNIVPNWSFEEYTQCPGDYNQVERATGWQRSWNNNVVEFHTEYLNACADYDFGVPTNVWGTQAASTGTAYMGQVSMAPSVTMDYRENIYIQLIEPLVLDQDYTVHLKLSWTDNCQHASNNQGVKFSTVPNFPIDGISQIYSDNIITDKLNWTEISGTFTADSAYAYVCVGNFFSDAETLTSTPCPTCPNYRYGYYIDDVCVLPKHSSNVGDCTVAYIPTGINFDLSHTNNFRVISSDGRLTVQFDSPLFRNAMFRLSDMEGRSLRSAQLTKGSTTMDLRTEELAPGAYLIIMRFGDERWAQRFIKL